MATWQNVRNYNRKRLIAIGMNPNEITTEVIKDFINKNPTKPKGSTRPPGYEDQKYCYYFLEDGECSLNNPIVRKRLANYVYKLIRFTGWIYKKNFIDPEDVFIEVQEEIKDLSPIEYGAKENTDAITFLIKKINTQVGREWWKYLKVMAPAYYDKLKEQQKHPKNISGKRNTDKKVQQKMRQELTDSYLIQCVYNNLKYQTGMKYTFDEIRTTFPHLIEQKRDSIMKERNKNNAVL